MRKIFLILLITIIGVVLIYAYRTPIKSSKNRLQALNIQKEIDMLVSEGQTCSTDTDCMVANSMAPCSPGLTSFNQYTNIEKIKSLYQEQRRLYPVEYQCAYQPKPSGKPHPICQQNTCVLTYLQATSTSGNLER